MLHHRRFVVADIDGLRGRAFIAAIVHSSERANHGVLALAITVDHVGVNGDGGFSTVVGGCGHAEGCARACDVIARHVQGAWHVQHRRRGVRHFNDLLTGARLTGAICGGPAPNEHVVVYTVPIKADFTGVGDDNLHVLVVTELTVLRKEGWSEWSHNGSHNRIVGVGHVASLCGNVCREGREDGAQGVSIAVQEGCREGTVSSVGGFRIEVARRFILATEDLQLIANAVAVCVVDALTFASVVLLGIETRLVVADGRCGVVVASKHDGATRTSLVLTRAVVQCSDGVEVACEGVGTTFSGVFT